jgi:hypothetical protein
VITICIFQTVLKINFNVKKMYVMESGGHRVAPVGRRIKKVDYKTQNESTNDRSTGGGGGGGGGGGTHIATTVKNTVRRLLRRTKSHRDTPSVYPTSITSTSTNTTSKTTTTTAISNVDKAMTIGTRTPVNPSDGTVRRSQQPPPPPPPAAPSSQYQTIRASTCRNRRMDYRQRPRLQVRQIH